MPRTEQQEAREAVAMLERTGESPKLTKGEAAE